MGFLDFLKHKPQEEIIKVAQDLEPKEISPDQSAIIRIFEHFSIPQNTKALLWIADGQFKNYNFNDDREIFRLNDRWTVEFIFKKEPSLIFSNLPIIINGTVNPKEKIGYFPSYETLRPDQRFLYLKWLCDIRNPIDIGYVFIFYYGLERHLIYGKYKEAIDTILFLRRYHKNSSFYWYSSGALIASTFLHRDKDALEKILSSIGTNNVDYNTLLIAKYLLKIPLSPKEIMAQANAVKFKNNRYILKCPELFEENVGLLLKSEFGEPFFPFYNLSTNYTLEHRLVFANTSLSTDTRSPLFPSIATNEVYKTAIYKILATTHETVKQKIAEGRKTDRK